MFACVIVHVASTSCWMLFSAHSLPPRPTFCGCCTSIDLVGGHFARDKIWKSFFFFFFLANWSNASVKELLKCFM